MDAAEPVQPIRLASPRTFAFYLLVAATLLVFLPSLAAPFHLDDVTLFTNPIVQSPSGWWYAWSPLQSRPLTYFTFWLNFQAGGQNPIGYHAFNISIHVLAVWLFYRLIVRIADPRAALIAVAIFALHPIQVEPVAYIFERATLLAAVFCLLAAHSWLDGNTPRTIGLFVFALLSKEECVAFPVFLWMLRPALLPVLSMLGLSLAAGLRVLFALERLQVTGAGSRAGISPLDYLLTQSTVIWRYFRLTILPYGFTCDPQIPIVNDWRAWMSWIALLALAALLWKVLPYGKWFAVGLILLSPSSSVFPAEDLAADRRMYLPMIAFALFFALLLRNVRRTAFLIPIAVAIAALSALRVQVWRSERALWSEAVERAPDKIRPRLLLARESDPATAFHLLDSARSLAPNDPRPYIEKGLRLMAANQPAPALLEFEQAILLAPKDVIALNNSGVALAKLGRRDEAIEQFRRALRVDSCSASARTNLERLGVPVPAACR